MKPQLGNHDAFNPASGQMILRTNLAIAGLSRDDRILRYVDETYHMLCRPVCLEV